MISKEQQGLPEPKDPVGCPAILIVEDHLPTGKAVLALLRSAFPEYHLLVADSAEGALERCEVDAPELVIMDISLPGMNGMEATRRIKALSPATHVVMHTSNDTLMFRNQSATLGASAFVSKRDTSSELVPAIARLLPPAGQPRGQGRARS